MLAYPDIVEAELLGLHRGLADRLRPCLAADMRQMDAELHHVFPFASFRSYHCASIVLGNSSTK